ncbi:hypothetical protein JMN32_17500 [Fulvivirga sp. 29W222]|uniref:O-antigen ligase n=1 Tax=Fulvivirga marina TaxID=2494733 RepID=A0A937G115_9BACT|nr:hypothetical protein [Fulvivirga marina]MBL6448118.1 hypothetical protein [Fulvivirga marina]
MVYKKDIINILFVASFPIFGLGTYISASKSPSLGYLVSAAPYVLIVLFYLVDLLYRREFQIRVNIWYLTVVLFLLSTVASLFIALGKNLPDTTQSLTIARSIVILMPFQAFVVVHLYNEKGTELVRLTFISLTLLLLINLVGYFALGLSNNLHSIEGRVNFPFIDGIYSGACLVAILSLMLAYYFRSAQKHIGWLTGWLVYFSLNLVLLFLINSRLTTMIFLVVLLLILLKAVRSVKSIYWVSVFTLPILLNTGLLIYKILNLPVFVSILKRVDLIDVSTFNGRAFLWQDAFNWLLYDQRGLLLGNGYRGHYFLEITSNVARLWNEQEAYHMHLHSTSLEILVSQGLFMLIIFFLLFYKALKYYRPALTNNEEKGMYLAILIFLLFIMEVDTFLYLESLGAIIFSWLLSYMVVDSPGKSQKRYDINNQVNLKISGDGINSYSRT